MIPSSDKNLTYIIDKIDLCYGTEVEITLSMINCFYYTDIFIICLYFTNCKPILWVTLSMTDYIELINLNINYTISSNLKYYIYIVISMLYHSLNNYIIYKEKIYFL